MNTHTEQPAPADAIVDTDTIHDLLNPLTSVVGNLHLLDELLGDSAMSMAARRITAAMTSAQDLRDMLDNVRDLMTGTLRPAADADADIAVILEQVWRNARTRDAAGCGELVIPEPGSVVVRGGPDPLRRAMQALVQSALRIGRQTRVEVQRAAAQVELAITHRGRRLEPALAGRLFDPDFTGVQNELGVKIDRARGLWFASCAVQAHEGTLTYEPMGDGGRFVVNLPLSPKASPRP